MPDDRWTALARHRLEKAGKCLVAAIHAIQNELYDTAVNRSYYCIFHAMRAVLALDGYDSQKHSGIISIFRQNYVKTGIFPTSFSDIIGNSFVARNNSDYDDFFFMSKDEASEQTENAKIFLEAITSYIGMRLS